MPWLRGFRTLQIDRQGTDGARRQVKRDPVPLRTRLLTATLVVPALIAATGLATTGSLRAISSGLADPLSILAMRSPGARDGAALTQSKPLRQAAEGPEALPPSRGFGKHVPVATLPRPVVGPVPTFEPLDLGEETPIEGLAFVPGVAGTFGAGEVGTPAGIAGGGGPAGVPIPSLPQAGLQLPDVPGPVSAVPEPRGWLVMIAGFFLLGAALRRNRPGRVITHRERKTMRVAT